MVNGETTFDTETMAELHVKQGLIERAIEIYRRLAARAADPDERARHGHRADELARAAAAPALELPGLRVRQRGDALDIEWRLPADTAAPALQLLLLIRAPSGIVAEPRTVPLPAPEGRTTVTAAALHSVRVAVGRLDGERFVPVIRLGAAPPRV